MRRSSRPWRVQRRTSRNKRAAERDQRDQADHVKAAEPDAGELVAGFGEKRHGDGEQKYHRPRRGEPHILLFMAAKRLHLIDVGGLERQHRKQRDAGDGADVIAGEAVGRHDVPEIERKPDRRDQSDLDHADDAGENDRRIGPFEIAARRPQARRRRAARGAEASHPLAASP